MYDEVLSDEIIWWPVKLYIYKRLKYFCYTELY